MMNSLQEKSLHILELPAILEQWARLAVSDAAKEAIRAQRPARHQADAVRWQEETSAACKLIGLRGSPSFGGLCEVGDVCGRAELGGVLSPRELLRVAGVLRAARTIKSYGSGEEKTALDGLFATLQGNKYMEEKIFNTIIGEEEIADHASPLLADLRRQMRVHQSRVRETLQKMISSSSMTKYLQENIITMRGDRYVVPVKSEYRGEVPGLTHDVSASGATLFVEPMAVVRLNNELRELISKEQREVERILFELSAEVAGFSGGIESDTRVLTALDVIFAKGKLSYDMEAHPPVLGGEGHVTLHKARHPLLDKKTAVPITIELGGSFDALVVTGPNTGGKTVALKTLGLLCLMAACGLHIPAEENSRVSLFDEILADIGDEQSIEQSLSTFSAHMTNIVEILRSAGPRSLVLYDELGAGTDPVEGAALAVAIMEETRRRGAKVAATTHYAELKANALTTPGVKNASCEFDVETLRPTFRLLIGVPGKSNAFAISQRLGLPEEVIGRAQGFVHADDKQLEEVLGQLESERIALEKQKEQTERHRSEAERDHKAANEARAHWERERDKITERARAEARLIVEQARQAADDALRELAALRDAMEKEKRDVDLGQARSELRRSLNEAQAAITGRDEPPEPPQAPQRPLVMGDSVELVKLGVKATVLEITPTQLTLQAGIMKLTAAPDDVRLIDEPKAKVILSSGGQPKELAMRQAVKELDLRGQMTEEGVMFMEQFLDDAVMARLEVVTVIHGKGTGALRTAVHMALRRNKHVKNFRLGRFGEGEMGVTIVELK